MADLELCVNQADLKFAEVCLLVYLLSAKIKGVVHHTW